MKKFLLAFALAAFALTGIGCTRIGVGEAGIKVSMAGSDKGVNDIAAQTGWVFYNPLLSDVIEYPTFVQTAVWASALGEGKPQNEEISFNSKDGLVFRADVNLSYHLEFSKVPQFYAKYRAKDLDAFTHGLLRQVARDEFNNVASTYLAEDLYGAKKEAYVTEVKKRLNAHFAPEGLVVESLGFIGAPKPPDQFVHAINAKLAATQNAIRAENELRQAEAEAKKQVAKAEGEAASNRALTASLTPSLLEWRKLEIQEKGLSKWNGHLPTYMGGNTPTPFIDVSRR